MVGRDQVLFIDDDPVVRKLVRKVLEDDGFDIVVAEDGPSGLDEARRRRPDLILLDQTLPGLSGIEVCRELKRGPLTGEIPVIFLSSKDEKVDVIVGLGVGADDYVTKPFDPKELAARIRAVLRRTRTASREPEPLLNFGPIQLDRGRLEASVEGDRIVFSVAEFRILLALAEAKGVILTRDQILDKINHGETIVSDRTVDVHVNSIRRKLGAHAGLVQTVRGMGYRFQVDRFIRP